MAASSQSELAITSAYESVLQVWLCQTCSSSLKGEFLFTQKKRGAGAGCVSPLAEVWRKSIPPKWIAKHLPIFRYRQIGLTIKKRKTLQQRFSLAVTFGLRGPERPKRSLTTLFCHCNNINPNKNRLFSVQIVALATILLGHYVLLKPALLPKDKKRNTILLYKDKMILNLWRCKAESGPLFGSKVWKKYKQNKCDPWRWISLKPGETNRRKLPQSFQKRCRRVFPPVCCTGILFTLPGLPWWNLF